MVGTCTKVVDISTSVFVKCMNFGFFLPLPLAYSYWVVFSLNIQIDRQSKQVFEYEFTLPFTPFPEQEEFQD